MGINLAMAIALHNIPEVCSRQIACIQAGDIMQNSYLLRDGFQCSANTSIFWVMKADKHKILKCIFIKMANGQTN